ncbi:jerky protein homolog-like [Diachasma alloeum]|uniref:jerky protein homolog-like n=1 Tax=Diachasma alloeum TaxID=454923 RepID=UPI0007382051|nr:jerky protein homolog-like [Diachasma alloeum]
MSDPEISPPLSPNSPTPQSPKFNVPVKKRRNTSVEVHEKLKALEKVKLGCPRHIVAKELGVHSSTVDGWIKNEKALQKWATEHNGVMPTAKKRLRKPVHELIDRAMWLWHRERSAAGCSITGPSAKIQALLFRNQLKIAQTFTASQGWLTKWQRRYGVKFSPQNGASSAQQAALEDDKIAADKYRAKLVAMIETEGLTSDQVFFCHLIGLNYRQLPDLVMNVKWTPEGHPQKQLKERITLLACTNASGSCKIPLVLVGKFPKPRAIKNLTQLPVCYRNQMSSYMTGRIFTDWFNNDFCPTVNELLISRGVPPKAILFMDNCLLLPHEMKNQDIRVELLPRNISVLLQPFDKAWLRNLKVSYRQQLIKFLMNNLSVGVSLDEAMKNLTIREVIFWLANSWSKLSDDMIVQSWKPLWPQLPDTEPPSPPPPLPPENQVKLEENSSEIQIKVEGGIMIEEGESSTDLFQQNEIALIREFCEALNRTNHYRSVNFIDIEKWLHPATKLTEDECLDEDEIVQIIMEENETNQQIENAPAAPPPPDKPKPTLAEAQASLKKVIDYCSTNSHYSREQRLSLIAIRDIMNTEKKIPTTPAAVVSSCYEHPPFDFVAIAEDEDCQFTMYEK